MHSASAPTPGPARHLLLCLLFLCAPVQAVDWLAPLKIFGKETEIVVWQGPGMYVKIVEQDRYKKYERPAKNDHPAAIGAKDIAAVLASLTTGNGGGAADRNAPLFTSGEIGQVAPKLAEALGRAQSRQDVIFAVSDAQGKPGRGITAARVFVEAGRLNLILGDTLQSGGQGAPQLIDHDQAPWRPGRRRESMETAQSMGSAPGVSFRPGARSPRYDWAIIDVRSVVATYRGPQIPLATAPGAAPTGGADAGVETNAQLLQERQQMRLEMARMRKQLESQQGGASTANPPPAAQESAPIAAPQAATTEGTPGATAPVEPRRSPAVAAPAQMRTAAPAAAPAGAQSMEQRLSTLQALHAKKLITDEEYAAKRKAILDEL